jgi:D-serine deaminase-like pyridoxal phosphate-dependent protein
MNEARVASGVATEIDVFIEINVGQNRCGVEPGAPAGALAAEIPQASGLELCRAGSYHGKAQHMRGQPKRHRAITDAIAAVVQINN